MGNSAAQLTGGGEGEENKIQEKMEGKRKKGSRGGGGRRPWEDGEEARGGIKGENKEEGERREGGQRSEGSRGWEKRGTARARLENPEGGGRRGAGEGGGGKGVTKRKSPSSNLPRSCAIHPG